MAAWALTPASRRAAPGPRRRCDGITTPAACNAYKPVAVDVNKVQQYLAQDLDRINNRVANLTK